MEEVIEEEAEEGTFSAEAIPRVEQVLLDNSIGWSGSLTASSWCYCQHEKDAGVYVCDADWTKLSAAANEPFQLPLK